MKGLGKKVNVCFLRYGKVKGRTLLSIRIPHRLYMIVGFVSFRPCAKILFSLVDTILICAYDFLYYSPEHLRVSGVC